MAKRKVVEEIVEEEQAPPLPPAPCGFCGQSGQVLKGWDEEGNDILETCNECGGDGIVRN